MSNHAGNTIGKKLLDQIIAQSNFEELIKNACMKFKGTSIKCSQQIKDDFSSLIEQQDKVIAMLANYKRNEATDEDLQKKFVTWLTRISSALKDNSSDIPSEIAYLVKAQEYSKDRNKLQASEVDCRNRPDEAAISEKVHCPPLNDETKGDPKVLKKKSLLKQKDEEIERLTEFIGKQMNLNLKNNEEMLENVAVKERPMNITENYEMLKTQEWLEAKVELDDKLQNLSEKEKLQFLCTILMVAEKTSKTIYIRNISRVFKLFTAPQQMGNEQTGVNSESISSQVKDTLAKSDEEKTLEEVAEEYKIPSALKIQMCDHYRNASTHADVGSIVNEICKVLFSSETPSTIFIESGKAPINVLSENYPKLLTYITQSAKVAWKMALQRPQMKFDCKTGINSNWAGENMQNPYYKSDNPKDPSSLVRFFVHPALLHGETLMSKPTVFISKEALEM